MATVTRENIGLLTDKITVNVSKGDYLPSFEKSLKQYGKQANIPGFRKGMVPAGLIKKMYGNSVFTDEVLRTVEKELTTYMSTEKLEIFAQPLPLPENDARQIDINNPADYSFAFEVGLKPSFNLADLPTADAEPLQLRQWVAQHYANATKNLGIVSEMIAAHGAMVRRQAAAMMPPPQSAPFAQPAANQLSTPQ